VFDKPSLFNESKLAIQGKRPFVTGEHAKAQLVQTLLSRPCDSGHQQRCPHTTSAPPSRNHHRHLTEAERRRVDVKLADNLATHNRDEGAIQLPPARPSLNINRRLGSDAVALLRDARKQLRRG